MDHVLCDVCRCAQASSAPGPGASIFNPMLLATSIDRPALQYGPFPKEFAKTIYYDPRESGSVLATTNDDINLVLRPSRGSSAH